MQENKTELILETHQLSKTFKGQHAVNGISLHIPDCSIYGLLGPNGAGKSTTMNMITGYLSPTSGTVRVNGYDIADEPEKALGIGDQLEEAAEVMSLKQLLERVKTEIQTQLNGGGEE